MTPSSNSSESTRPKGRVLWEELLVLSRLLQADKWNFCPLKWLDHTALKHTKDKRFTVKTQKVFKMENIIYLCTIKCVDVH